MPGQMSRTATDFPSISRTWDSGTFHCLHSWDILECPGMPQQVLSGKGQSVAALDLPVNMMVCITANNKKYQQMCDYCKVKNAVLVKGASEVYSLN